MPILGIECDATIEDDEGKVHCSIPPVTKSQVLIIIKRINNNFELYSDAAEGFITWS